MIRNSAPQVVGMRKPPPSLLVKDWACRPSAVAMASQAPLQAAVEHGRLEMGLHIQD